MTASSSQFSAADSAIGYLYQVRVALLWALRRMKHSNDFFVSLETLDDVTFEVRGGTPEELLQTKHHCNRKATLTDACSDLWKTLRVWFEGYAEHKIPLGTALHLLTTAQAPVGSAASYLRIGEGRDVDAALQRLEAVANSSTNVANTPAYSVFLAASSQERRALFDHIVVLDAAPSIMDLNNKLEEEVFWAVERKHLETFMERLEGWWLRRALRQLAAASLDGRVLGIEIESQMADLREQFKLDSLPIDDDLLDFDLDEVTKAAHDESTFVRQLELLTIGKGRIAAAIRDYYRAFEQRSRWLRNDLLIIGDLSRYERRLLEEWELVFEGVKDELSAEAVEAAKREAALKVLRWAEQVSLPIRKNVTEPFVTRGSLHMLADQMRIGWHPEFRERLAALLGDRERAA